MRQCLGSYGDEKLSGNQAVSSRLCLQLEYCYFSNLLLLLEVWVAPRSATLHKVLLQTPCDMKPVNFRIVYLAVQRVWMLIDLLLILVGNWCLEDCLRPMQQHTAQDVLMGSMEIQQTFFMSCQTSQSWSWEVPAESMLVFALGIFICMAILNCIALKTFGASCPCSFVGSCHPQNI